jgi:copper chaperone CopZ
MTALTYRVEGMTCNGCRGKVAGILSALVERADVQLSPAEARLEGGLSGNIAALNAALAQAGSYRLFVPEGTAQPISAETWSAAEYWPLIVVVSFLVLGSLAANWHDGAMHWHGAMNGFMGAFFLVFAAFKFLDLRGFASAYAEYDLLAKRLPAYGRLYPFLEAGLGLAYLAGLWPVPVLLATIVLMVFSSLGVIAALRQKRVIRCACLGTVLVLPMSTVTLVEDLGMALMAAAMLWFSL